MTDAWSLRIPTLKEREAAEFAALPLEAQQDIIERFDRGERVGYTLDLDAGTVTIYDLNKRPMTPSCGLSPLASLLNLLNQFESATRKALGLLRRAARFLRA